MWKSIKNFFKWIADHTGISWILGKLDWKNHQSTGQEEDFVFLGMPQSEAPAKSKTKHTGNQKDNFIAENSLSDKLMERQVQEKQNDITSQWEVGLLNLKKSYDLRSHPKVKQILSDLISRTEKLNDDSRTFAHKNISKLCDNKEEKEYSNVLKEQAEGEYIVINGVIIPEGAKLKFFPELSDFLSKASLEREKLFCKVVPNSLFTQLITPEQVANNDRSC
ncbi:hypothetical protein Wcon_00115 [Wolbachia endosymbiont of Cylisticus convexus]|uniref:hypothetical protein n=1 Tax=Wolbachia endosymbiont of Cylisticus convexus TaxID=118728 RepID=UPI000DF68337|nr:hypothetical protein [Wolbachia endosymbiont of Cylisticus convexus]RDD35698.1 hypothetical protein Wcon_00115 [Wolbachia endosymbiont of Cylisticus convexus]